ncbi:MAG TPA: reverse transcriptase domain-containing protein, partial [Saprospiraceae bacterium]|nr:reverse transcriptase domain-containing protein [Saprospiraceae bacterium]
KKASGWVIFVDFKKAYDSVSHDWIKHIVYSLGDKKWESLISNILDESCSKIKGDEELIFVRRGVRQGDPLSPLLFNLCIAPLLNRLKGGIEVCEKKI